MRINDFFATDKVAHFGVSFALTSVVAAFFSHSEWCVVWGAVVALLIGIGKEVYDKVKGGVFDGFDLWADMAGILCAVFCKLPFVAYISELEKMLAI